MSTVLSAKRPANFEDDRDPLKRARKSEGTPREDRDRRHERNRKRERSDQPPSSRDRDRKNGDKDRIARDDGVKERDGERERRSDVRRSSPGRVGRTVRSPKRERSPARKDRSRERPGKEPSRRDKARNRSPPRASSTSDPNQAASVVKSKAVETKPVAMEVDTPTEAGDGVDPEMMRVMGFRGFKSTKNTKVPGNDKLFGIRKEKKTEYRQYMNRPGGFNRPLSPSR